VAKKGLWASGLYDRPHDELANTMVERHLAKAVAKKVMEYSSIVMQALVVCSGREGVRRV